MSSHSPFAIPDALDLRLPSRSRGSEKRVPVERFLQLDNLRSWAERALDFLAVLAAVFIAVRCTYRLSLPSNKLLFNASLALAGFFVLLMERQRAYQSCVSLLAIRETERLLRAVCQIFFGLIALNLVAGAPVSWFALCSCTLAIAACAGAQKFLLHCGVSYLRSHEFGVRRALIVGSGVEARKLYSCLIHSPKLGFEPVAFLDEHSATTARHLRGYGYFRGSSAEILQEPLSSSLLRRLRVEALFLAEPRLACEVRKSIITEAATANVSIFLTAEYESWTSTSNVRCQPTKFSDFDGTAVAHLVVQPSRFLYETLKQAVDFVFALVLLIGLAPVFLVVGSLVALTSSGPILFRQQRAGRDGRPFQMFKFRTMHVEADAYACSPKLGTRGDVTPVGRWLRRSGLDELPQLINVLMGDMSLVGPRPEMPFLVQQYTPEMRQRLTVKPGITGLWQISADRAFHIHENLEYDVYYARHRTVFMDFAILLHTLVFAPRGA